MEALAGSVEALARAATLGPGAHAAPELVLRNDSGSWLWASVRTPSPLTPQNLSPIQSQTQPGCRDARINEPLTRLLLHALGCSLPCAQVDGGVDVELGPGAVTHLPAAAARGSRLRSHHRLLILLFYRILSSLYFSTNAPPRQRTVVNAGNEGPSQVLTTFELRPSATPLPPRTFLFGHRGRAPGLCGCASRPHPRRRGCSKVTARPPPSVSGPWPSTAPAPCASSSP